MKAVVRPGVTEHLGLLLCHNTIQLWTARSQLCLEARGRKPRLHPHFHYVLKARISCASIGVPVSNGGSTLLMSTLYDTALPEVVGGA